MEPINIKFYSEDWRRIQVLAITSLPYYDIMVDENNIYLIKLPKYNSTILGLFLGFIFFPLIGAFPGAFIGSQIDAKKRKNYRSTWLNFDSKIISQDYKKDIFLKLPLKNFKNNLILKKINL